MRSSDEPLWYVFIIGRRPSLTPSRAPQANYDATIQGWIGVNDIATEGTYVWSDGSTYGDYTTWASGEPNNHDGDEDCGQLYNTRLWNDLPCSVTISGAVCKRTGGTPPPSRTRGR